MAALPLSRRGAGISFILFILGASVFLNLFSPKEAYAHFEHRSHYNGREDRVGQYAVFQALDPEYAGNGKPVAIEISIQDKDGRDTYDIITMVEIYYSRTGERVYSTPWTLRQTGDFNLYYTFQERGSYQIVVSFAEKGSDVGLNGIDPPRSILSSTLNCDCLRSVFTVNISEGFGLVWSITTYVAIIAPVAVLGSVLGFSYRSRSKKGQISKRDLLKYAVMLSGLAGGAVHLAVYPEHALLRLEYSIFLLSAAGAQIVYGILFTLMTLTNDTQPEKTTSRSSLKAQYKKTLAVNLIGLIGSGVLLGLYAYAVIFPPPLSPNDRPEQLEFVGILAKSLEVFLVVGILALMKWDKQNAQARIASAAYD